jgi:hypothetical protein
MRVCFAALLLFSFFCIGCKKTGPQGATGATGANGPAGPIGPAGDNGSVIYSGTVTPAASVGNVGDFYMDLGTSTLYGPKTASGWGSGFSLKGDSGTTGAVGDSGATGATGATGANGKAGTQIYAGTGVPDPTLGVTGDFYMDTMAHNLYGPKQTAGWGTPIALQGPAGATGAIGAAGATGPQGPAGTANVLYTPWVTPTSWSHLVGYGSQDIIRHTELIPAITAAIVQGGTVLCYAQLDDYNTTIWPDGQIGQMPITVMFKYNGVEAIDTWEITIATGSSAIEVYDSNNNYLNSTFTESLFRWVIIPGGSAVSGSVPRQKQVSHGETFQR